MGKNSTPHFMNGKKVSAGTAAVSTKASHHFQPRRSATGWAGPG
jgi:hypothetical protein